MDNLKHILIVDSNQSIREKLADNFTKDGFQATAASGEEEALTFIAKQTPDLILSEILLDDCDGVQFCKNIKNNPNLANIPLVVLTSANDHVIEIKSLRNGVDEFFVKRNITRQELMLKVQILLERFSMYNFIRRTNCFDFQGNLSTTTLKSLLRMLSLAKKTGQLHIANSYSEGTILFQNGDIVNAVLGVEEGLDAIFKIDKLTEAIFAFDSLYQGAINTTVDQPTETILSLLED